MAKQQKRSVGRPKGTGTSKARELSSGEIDRLTRCTESPRDKALIWLCLGGGLRIGEACTMTMGHVTPKAVRVEKSRAKGKESRWCRLAPTAVKHLQAYLATRPDAAPHEALFPSRKGGACMRPNWGVRLVDGLLEAAGIQGASSHSLRRSHANTLRRAGVDLTIIQGQLGHQDLATTAEYLSASEVEAEAALDRIKF